MPNSTLMNNNFHELCQSTIDILDFTSTSSLAMFQFHLNLASMLDRALSKDQKRKQSVYYFVYFLFKIQPFKNRYHLSFQPLFIIGTMVHSFWLNLESEYTHKLFFFFLPLSLYHPIEGANKRRMNERVFVCSSKSPSVNYTLKLIYLCFACLSFSLTLPNSHSSML